MYTVILVTVPSKAEARRIARGLLKEKLAACVNIIGRVDSLFWWKGKIEQAAESLLIIKSRRSKAKKIIQAVKSMHSYEVPEIICLPIVEGHKPYLRWIDESIR
ncbi:MAG: divalent-cation tolerance protein CutA [Candidatus Omnitrophota bacterium]